MASRTKQKEEARARRVAEERARVERERRQRRTRLLGGVLIGAVAIIAVAIAISSGGGGTKKITATEVSKQAATVNSLVAGIPQSGNTIGNPKAQAKVTEFGDLECSHCQAFALGSEQALISNDVKSGKVQLDFKSLETASGANPNPNIFVPQQAAAYAAGLQGKAWNYILLFYALQGQEGTNYVTQDFLDKIARAIPGLNYNKWLSDSQSAAMGAQVQTDEQLAAAQGFNSTPTLTIQGPKGQAKPIVGVSPYGPIESAIKSVQ